MGIHLFRRSSGPQWPEADFGRRLFDHLKPDCVFDVGANVGQYASGLRTIEGFEGTIISFEPNPRAFEKLNAAAANDPNWHCLPYALGAKTERKTLYVTEIDVFASLRRPAGQSKEHFAEQTKIAGTPEIEVVALAEKYDELQRLYGFSRPFLKMDTQGSDLDVVAGARESLQNFCGLLSEVAITPLYEGAPMIEQSVSEFRERGFTVVGLFDVQASDAFTQIIECNCYCVRNDLAATYATA